MSVTVMQRTRKEKAGNRNGRNPQQVSLATWATSRHLSITKPTRSLWAAEGKPRRPGQAGARGQRRQGLWPLIRPRRKKPRTSLAGDDGTTKARPSSSAGRKRRAFPPFSVSQFGGNTDIPMAHPVRVRMWDGSMAQMETVTGQRKTITNTPRWISGTRPMHAAGHIPKWTMDCWWSPTQWRPRMFQAIA